MSLPSPNPQATILVTGASAGIGTELARQLAERGHNVTLVARRKERLTEIAEEIRLAHGVTADVRKCDLANQGQRTRLINELKEGDKAVVGVCNNAGFGSFGRFADLDLDSEMEMVRLNVLALHELTGAFLPAMISRRSGAILNVASVAAFQPFPTNATYSATKAFVHSFSEAVAAELSGTGVSVTSLCPGPVSTEFGEAAGVGEAESQLPGAVTQGPEEVARAGIEGMIKGKRTVFPGIVPRVMAQAGRFTPRTLLLPVANKLGGRAFGGD